MMGFLSRTYETISDWVVGLFYRITGRSEEWEIRRQLIREKRYYIGLLINSEIQYEPEEPDKQLALQAADYLKSRFPNGIQNTLGEMSADERVRLFFELAEDVRSLFDVDEIQFEIATPESEEEFRSMGLGFYNHLERRICLNGACIEYDNPELWEEQVFTIIHEMKHARQYAAVSRTHDYGYSDDLLALWKYNIVHYIRSVECDEAYRKQAIENDSFGFEELVRENMKL